MVGSERKKCSVLADVSVYVLADYRQRPFRKMIARLYEKCVKENYGLKWVGYSEDPRRYDFTADGKNIAFNADELAKFDEIEFVYRSAIEIVFIGRPADKEEMPIIIELCPDSSESKAIKYFKMADRLLKDTETDAKKRFAEVTRAVRLDDAGHIFDPAISGGVVDLAAQVAQLFLLFS